MEWDSAPNITKRSTEKSQVIDNLLSQSRIFEFQHKMTSHLYQPTVRQQAIQYIVLINHLTIIKNKDLGRPPLVVGIVFADLAISDCQITLA
jgi:hypothetical protein